MRLVPTSGPAAPLKLESTPARQAFKPRRKAQDKRYHNYYDPLDGLVGVVLFVPAGKTLIVRFVCSIHTITISDCLC